MHIGASTFHDTAARVKIELTCVFSSDILLIQVRDAQQEGTPRINPRNITGHIAKIKSGFSQGSQEDSHEAYVGMIEQMEAVLLHEAGGKAAVPEQRSQETTLMNHCFTSYMSCQVRAQR